MLVPIGNQLTEYFMELFGRTIATKSSITLTEQVADILLEAIHAGEWRVGDRLPSISTLAADSGVGRRPIQIAMERLAERGYLRQIRSKGTFLASLTPRQDAPSRTVGLLVDRMDEQGGDFIATAFRRELQHRVMEVCEAQNLRVRVVYLEEGQATADINRIGTGPFSDDVHGILSLYPFSRPHYSHLQPGRLPLVFLGRVLDDSLPLVTGDTWQATYELTRQAIDHGHRDIVFFSKHHTRPGDQAVEHSMYGHLAAYRGYAAAMHEVGLPINENAIEESQHIHYSDLAGLRQFIERYAAATAMIVQDGMAATNLAAVAGMFDRQVPRDLSILSREAGMLGPDKQLTHATYDDNQLVELGLKLLDELADTGTCFTSRIQTTPVAIRGDSLARLSK